MLCSLLGVSVLQVTATDADDPTYGNSARIVYSILQGQPYFSVDPKTGVVLLHALDKVSTYALANMVTMNGSNNCVVISIVDLLK